MKRSVFLRRCLHEFKRTGTLNLWAYLLMWHHACAVLGGRLPGPLGNKGYNERVLGLCLACAAAFDLPDESLRPHQKMEAVHGGGPENG